MAETDTSGSAYARGAERVRDAAKWLLGAFGAIAAVMVAGSQLSSIGSMDDGKRLLVAILAAVVALAGLAIASWLILDIMLPSASSLTDISPAIAKEIEDRPELLQGNESVASLKESYIQALQTRLDVVKKNYTIPPGASDVEVKAAGALVVVLGQAVQQVEGYAAYERLDDKLRDTPGRFLIFVLAGVVAAAIVLFAWAANPPEKPESPTSVTSLAGLQLAGASLRGAGLANADLARTSFAGADLRGADLAGASLDSADLSSSDLRGADLSGATLTNTDLTGAQVNGALLSGVVWGNTTCPDGSQSSDDPEATCIGHEAT